MPIWRTAPVEEQPHLTLVRWRVIETEQGERHFCGYCPENLEGRVSSRITHFDHATRRGITRSGRVYELVGEPGLDLDAEYVLNFWLSRNGVETWTDVTDTIVNTSS